MNFAFHDYDHHSQDDPQQQQEQQQQQQQQQQGDYQVDDEEGFPLGGRGGASSPAGSYYSTSSSLSSAAPSSHGSTPSPTWQAQHHDTEFDHLKTHFTFDPSLPAGNLFAAQLQQHEQLQQQQLQQLHHHQYQYHQRQFHQPTHPSPAGAHLAAAVDAARSLPPAAAAATKQPSPESRRKSSGSAHTSQSPENSIEVGAPAPEDDEDDEDDNGDQDLEFEDRGMKRGTSGSSSSGSVNGLPKEDHSKLRHNACERRRQQTMNDAIQVLREYLPAANTKATKMVVVQRATAALGHYRDLSNRLLSDNAKLRRENDDLRRALGLPILAQPEPGLDLMEIPSLPRVQGPKKRPAPAIEVKSRPAKQATKGASSSSSSSSSTRGQQVKLLVASVFFFVSLAHFGWLPGTAGAAPVGAESAARSLRSVLVPVLSVHPEFDFGVDVILISVLTFSFHLITFLWKAVFCLLVLSTVSRLCESSSITPQNLLAVRKHRQQAEELLLEGKTISANEHITAGLELLGYGHFAQAEAYTLPMVLSCSFGFCLELVRQVLNRLCGGCHLDAAIVHVKGTEAIHAESSILVGQAFYIETMKAHAQGATSLFFQVYRLLTALNSSEIGGSESQGMFQMLCFAMTWLTDLVLLPRPITLRPLAGLYRRAAWAFSSSSIGPSNPNSIGRYFSSVAVENVRKANWQEAVFFFTEGLKYTDGNPNLQRAVLLGLAFARHLEHPDDEEVSEIMKQIQQSAERSQDRRWAYTVEVYTALNYLHEDQSPEKDRQALDLLEAAFVEDSWTQFTLKQSLDLDRTGLALAKLKCGKVEEALRLANEIGLHTVPVVFVFAFDFYFLDFQCELYITLLRLRRERPAHELPAEMPSEAELVKCCQKRLADFSLFTRAFEFASSTHLYRKGHLLMVTNRLAEAKTTLERAMQLAETYRMSVDQKKIGLFLKDLEDRMA